MNEQIEKLAVQAFSFASAADDSDESDANWWDAFKIVVPPVFEEKSK